MYTEDFFYNNWLQAEKKVTKNKQDILISYNLALENVEDLQYINFSKENLESIDMTKLTSLAGVRNYVFILIYFTEDRFKTFLKTSIENKKIDKNFDFKIYPDNQTKTYENAIVKLKEEIVQIWKSHNLIDINTPSFLDLFLDTKDLNDYLKISDIFNSINLIENYSVIEMTNEYIKVRIKYKGKINNLREKFSENKLSINIKESIWRAKVN